MRASRLRKPYTVATASPRPLKNMISSGETRTPSELEAETFELVGRDDDLTDFVLEVCRTDVEEVSTHGRSWRRLLCSAECLFERCGGVRRGVAVFHDDRSV